MTAVSKSGLPRYNPPTTVNQISLDEALEYCGRFSGASVGRALDLFSKKRETKPTGIDLFYAGSIDLIKRRCVAIVGTRNLSEEGRRRTRKLAALIAQADVAVASGLALGVDTEAHTSALAIGGKTVAVIGTPLDRCNPPRNAMLQEEIYKNHLLISQFAWGSTVYPTNFPKRNRVMAALSDATIIVEASDSSGTLHQAVECVRLGRPLFILKSVVDDKRLSWPKKFLPEPSVYVLENFDDITRVLSV